MKKSRGIQGVIFPALIAVAPFQLDAADCLKWIKRTDVGSYGQRMHHAMAFDKDRGVTVFFGGEIGKEGEQAYFDDTQEYNGTNWVQIPIIGPKPPARSLHAMAYDPDRKQIILAGGWNGDDHFRDTWIYTNERGLGYWTNVLSNVDIYKGHGMAFDSVRRRVITHGGLLNYLDGNGNPSFLWDNRTSEWDGQSWIEFARTPWGMYKFGFAFDDSRGIVMAAGGAINPLTPGLAAPVLEYRQGVGWIERAWSLSGRREVAMAYDERRQRVVMVGGDGISPEVGEEVYEYHPTEQSWIVLPRLESGQGRAGAKMIYDSRRGVMVLTGGAGGGAPNASEGGRYSDTWELVPTLEITTHPASITNEVCGTALFSVVAQGVGPFHYTWRRDGVPVTFSDGPVLTLGGVSQSDRGKYDVIVADSCGAQNFVTSKVAILTVQPGSQWVLRSTSGPPVRFYHSMVYDSRRGVTVLFGGQTNWNGIFPLNDLWEWDGARWTLRVENSVTNGWTRLPNTTWVPSFENRPVQRGRFGMAYDSDRGRTVIFGGLGLSPDQSQVNLKDVWEWDGTHWDFRGTNGPISRFDGSMTYDQGSRRTVLFGGQPIPSLGEQLDNKFVWEWDGVNWTKSESVGGPSPYNNFAELTYDSYRGVLVFGPTEPESILWSGWEFWEWDGTTWTRNTTVLDTLLGTTLGSLVFDRQLRRTFFFGGLNSSPQNDAGYYDGKEWTPLTNSLALPDPRVAAAMVYDSRRNVTVLFGGSLTYGGATGATNDTWELASVDTPLINEQPASQYRRPGETATFNVEAVGPGTLSYQWYKGTEQDRGALLSETGKMLTLSAVRAQDAGVYRAVVGNACGSAQTHAAVLTLDPRLQIFSQTNSTTLIWSHEARLVLETSETINGPWRIVPNPPIPFSIAAAGPNRFYRLRRT